MKKKINYVSLLLAITIVGFVSCKKSKNEEPIPNNAPIPTGTLMFHLHTYIDNNEVDAYNITYTTDAGRQVSLSIAQFYISDIQLVKADGSIYNIVGKKILKVVEAETYLIGDIPVGNYKSVRFKVGLDPITNSMNPTSTSDSILLNKPAMWFGSTAQSDGYVFLNVQGAIDTTAEMTGTPIPFAFKIGTNANYKQVTMSDKNFSIIKDQVEYVHLRVDYNKLFSGLQLNQNSNLSVATALANTVAPATIVSDNISAMFSYE